jgi:uncharacterized protein with beta-barrel porin domain
LWNGYRKVAVKVAEHYAKQNLQPVYITGQIGAALQRLVIRETMFVNIQTPGITLVIWGS